MVGSTGSRGFGSLFTEAKGKLDNLQKTLGSVLPSFPGKPVGKFDDLYIGADFHPTIAPPSPSMLVPHIGKVFDIMAAIMAGIASAIPTPEESTEDDTPPPASLGSMAAMLIKGMAPSVKVHGK